MKRPLGWLAGVTLAVMVVLFGLAIHQPQRVRLSTTGQTYTLQQASTTQERQKGLGGRGSMPADQGMLFVFDRGKASCFWMKDMRFSLDIIWLDASKRVVHMEQGVSPQTYPQTFCPETAATYVIELNAGEAARAHINTGQQLAF